MLARDHHRGRAPGYLRRAEGPVPVLLLGVRSLKWLGSGLYRCGRRGADLRSASAVILRSGGTRRTYRCRVGMHITINTAEVDEYVTARVCALLDKYGAGLLPGRDHEAINDLHAR